MACEIALKAVETVADELHGRKEIDIKRYAKVEKVGCGIWHCCCACTRLQVSIT